MVSAAGDFVYAKFSDIIVVIRPSCYFRLPSSVMIMLAFLFCFLVFSSLRTSFQLKQIIEFLN